MSDKLFEVKNWEALAREARFQPETIAALCSVSLRQLERFFAKNFKTTPTRWAKEVRCRLASKLIAAGWSNKAVVAELYYWDGPHLCREFKRVFGVPPQSFAPRHPRLGIPAQPAEVADVFPGPGRPDDSHN